MTKNTAKTAAVATGAMLFDTWFDPVEPGLRAKVRDFMKMMIEEELDTALSRPRYGPGWS